jgi:hypothetical protein
MSTRSKGASRERSFEARLWEVGFRTMRASASGQRIADNRRRYGLPGDLLAVAPIDAELPHLLCEVGGVGKRLAVAFAELTAQPLPPGFVPCIARCVARRWLFYTSPDDRFTDFADFIAALRTA